MVPNIKYYVVTITSIFLALGIGIFMGFMLDAESLVSTQREDIVTELQKTFDEMKQDTEKVRADIVEVEEKNKALAGFIDDSFPVMISEKLLGHSIAIVEVNEDYVYTDLSETLTKSGASLSSKTVVKDTLSESKARVEEIYRQVRGEDFDGEVSSLVANEISISIEDKMSTPFITALVEEGYIEIVGSYENGADTVLIAGGANSEDSESKELSQKTISALKNKEFRVIGVERSDVKHSYVGQYIEERVSSVDNVEGPIGKVSLIAVIRGENGNFGEREASTQFRPKLDLLLERD